MAYLRRWRKRNKVVTNALESSSDEGSVVQYTATDNKSDQNIITGTPFTPLPVQTNYSSEHDEFAHEKEHDEYTIEREYDLGLLDNSSDSEAYFHIPGLRVTDQNSVANSPSIHEKLAEWATKNQLTRACINELLGILRDEDMPIPKDARTLLQTPREIPTENKCGGKYAYFGLEAGILKTLQMYSSEIIPDRIDLLVNIDGIPLFKSSGTQFWPIICSFNNYKPFVVGIFYGESKPNSVDDYLENFLTEYSKLQENGILFNEFVIKTYLKAFICDAPARAFLKCIKGHTGYYACERCVIKGSWQSNRVVYNGDFTARTDAEFINKKYTDHQIGISPLSRAKFPCVTGFCLDYMHLVCLGVVKRIIWFFKYGPTICKLSQRHIGEISSNLVSFSGKLPSEFARQPRPLTEYERWKATEFRQFLLYTGPIVLKKILNKSSYQHFLCLTIAISILLDSDRKREAYIDYAQQLLDYFVEKSKDIYSEAFPVYNIHSLKHLADDVRTFQCSLNSISCFPFENHLQVFKTLSEVCKQPYWPSWKTNFRDRVCWNPNKQHIFKIKLHFA